MPSPADREKALETALAQIDRQFGKGSVMRLGSDERAPVAIIPTGSIALDVALGNRTPDEALAAGVPPREVWFALCAAQDVPPQRWHGAGRPKPTRG